MGSLRGLEMSGTNIKDPHPSRTVTPR